MYMKNLWRIYKDYVESVTEGGIQFEIKDINYWRDRLFKNFILYSLPTCLLALIPAIIIGIQEDHPYLIGFDVLIVVLIGCVSLNRSLNLSFRKALVMLLFYVFAVVVIANLGSFGPGILYLLAISVLSTLIFSVKIGYISVALHFLTTAIFAIIIQYHIFSIPLIEQYTLGSWIAFSSNLLFLSLICVVLISKIINGLEGTIINEVGLHTELKESKDHYKSLFVQNPSPMWVVDAQSHQFMQVNDAAISCYGFSKEEFLNLTVEKLRLACDAACLEKSVNEQITPSINDCHYTTRHLKKNKEIIDVEMRCNTITVEGKQAILAIGSDITRQQTYIKAVEEQNHRLHEIAYIQSHMVRAPLASIMGLVGLIKANMNDKPDPEVIHHLDASAQQFDQIIRNITNHACLDTQSA
jgi:PAS domain S-box-containing protein